MDKFNWHHLKKHYDFDCSKKSTIKISYLLNQIIHSYIFCPMFDDKKNITNLLINSDVTKNKILYSISFKKVIDIIMFISNGDMFSCKITRKDGKYLESDIIYESSIKLTDI